MQIQDCSVSPQAVFDLRSYTEDANILIDVPDSIFCWAEIGIWHSTTISKIHTDYWSLNVTLNRRTGRKSEISENAAKLDNWMLTLLVY